MTTGKKLTEKNERESKAGFLYLFAAMARRASEEKSKTNFQRLSNLIEAEITALQKSRNTHKLKDALSRKSSSFPVKKLMFILFIGMGFCAKAQTYHPFPESNAVWNILGKGYCGLGPTNEPSVHYSIVMKEDTIIKGATYHQLRTPFFEWSFSACLDPAKYNIYRGAIRQDISLKKVFFIPPATTSEQLLYDFTLEKGDTVKGYLTLNLSNADTVVSVDSVLVGGIYHKRINLNSEYKTSLIEGVGSTYGLVIPTAGRKPGIDWNEYKITCFKLDKKSLYPSTDVICETITSIRKDEQEADQVTVFPNPSNGSFTIECSNMIKEIRVNDLLGKLVFQQQLNNQSSYKITDLEKGTYVISVIDKNNYTNRKKIINLD